ncbi:MAG: LytTR family DNA-binding domain-containing protein [Flavobacteriaceae bacterium]|nr:LytTR family DNA-binding domain-containing protein [Flavobacteriaceae bacterium]
MILKCIIIDNDPLQRLGTLNIIKENISLKVIGEFSSAIESKLFLQNNQVDLIIMEVNFPVLNGFDLIDFCNNAKEISTPKIIITSHDESQAFKAFEYHIIDFISKPVNKNRFDKAISRVIYEMKITNNFQGHDSEHIFVKSNLKKRKIYLNEIKWIEALGDYVKLITNDKSFVILSTMKAFEKELPKKIFLRIHKSYIVNLKKVERYDSKHVEIEKIKLPLSRTRKSELVQALDI